MRLETGKVIAFLKFTSGVQEIFAIRVLAGRRQPELLNETVDLLRHAYVLPEADMADVAVATTRGCAERSPAGVSLGCASTWRECLLDPQVGLAEDLEAHGVQGAAGLLDVVDVHGHGATAVGVDDQRIGVMDVDLGLEQRRAEVDQRLRAGGQLGDQQLVLGERQLVQPRISRPCSGWLRISRRIEQSAESEIVRPTILTFDPWKARMTSRSWPTRFSRKTENWVTEGQLRPCNVSSRPRCRRTLAETHAALAVSRPGWVYGRQELPKLNKAHALRSMPSSSRVGAGRTSASTARGRKTPDGRKEQCDRDERSVEGNRKPANRSMPGHPCRIIGGD